MPDVSLDINVPTWVILYLIGAAVLVSLINEFMRYLDRRQHVAVARKRLQHEIDLRRGQTDTGLLALDAMARVEGADRWLAAGNPDQADRLLMSAQVLATLAAAGRDQATATWSDAAAIPSMGSGDYGPPAPIDHDQADDRTPTT